jgi:pyrroloquinoline quinone (PQQ) biosynthesis protein C
MEQSVPSSTWQLTSGPLSTAVQEMVQRHEDSLAEEFSETKRRTELLDLVRQVGIRASEDSEQKLELHQALNALYSLNFRIPAPGDPHPQFSPILVEIAESLERAFLDDLNQAIDTSSLEDAPEEAPKFRRWLLTLVRSHAAFRHPYYNKFLIQDATKEDLRFFFAQESFLDARFDDVLALLQLGTTGVVKNEIGSNFWDELGNGDLSGVHTDLFAQSLRTLGITDNDLSGKGLAEALAQGNLSALLVLKRRHFYKAVGFFFVTEFMAPTRFKCVIKSGERNHLSDEALAYQRLHVRIDVIHATGWMTNIIVPLVDKDPSVRHDIALGALYRLETSRQYLDMLYHLTRSHSASVRSVG